MEQSIIFRAGLKKHRGSLFGIMILLILSALSLCTVLTVYLQGNRYIREEIQRTGFGSLTAWVSDVENMDALIQSIGTQDGIEEVTVQNLIFSEYEGNGVESDSEGQLIPWQPESGTYRFFNHNLAGYREALQEIEENAVYVSPSMQSILNITVGDTITFPIARGGKNVEFVVAGYYEDPMMGSSMIGMKGFLISPAAYEQILQVIDEEGADALARSGAMLHITAERNAGLTISELNSRLNENTQLSQYTEFIHSAETMENFMLILQNAFCGLVAAFAFAFLLSVFVSLGHSISAVIEQDWKNLGILKTIGMTGKELVYLQGGQYAFSIAAGLAIGILGTIPTVKIVSRMMVRTSGVLIPGRIRVFPSLFVFAGLFLLFMLFVILRLKGIFQISPMGAIRGERKMEGNAVRKIQNKGHLSVIKASGLSFHLAVRQLLSGKRRYISACIVAALLVFFASLAGRMNDWLGSDGQGMMDAFNPADLDIGIQVLGELSREEMETVVTTYSEITDSYGLAMPSVSVDGTNYTANVITEPERFHISRGRTSRNADEVVLTEVLAADLEASVGEKVSIRGDKGTKEFTVSGIYHCANDMGANLGMSREGYLAVGTDDPRIWCHHYFLADPSQKQAITEVLENTYGGDVHVHENTWPGLFSIISAMHLLLAFMYCMSVIFICIVTMMTGSKILDAEKKDMGIYKSIGYSTQKLRFTFALRFGIVAAMGSGIGIILSMFFADPFVAAVMRFAGISNFASHPSIITVLMPGLFVTALFLAFAYIAAGKIKKEDMTVLTAE